MNKEFVSGFLAAVQFIAIGHDNVTMAIDAIRDSGLEEKELIDSQLKSGYCNEKIVPIIKKGCNRAGSALNR